MKGSGARVYSGIQEPFLPEGRGRPVPSSDGRCQDTSWPLNSLHSDRARLGQAKVGSLGAATNAPTHLRPHPQLPGACPRSLLIGPPQDPAGRGAALRDSSSQPLGQALVLRAEGSEGTGTPAASGLRSSNPQSAQEAPGPPQAGVHPHTSSGLSVPTVHKEIGAPRKLGRVTQAFRGSEWVRSWLRLC